jgi:hypothetical protein
MNVSQISEAHAVHKGKANSLSRSRGIDCPCGSGQKYKRCCRPRDEAAAAERAAALPRQTERFVPDATLGNEDDGLDDASNSVIA